MKRNKLYSKERNAGSHLPTQLYGGHTHHKGVPSHLRAVSSSSNTSWCVRASPITTARHFLARQSPTGASGPACTWLGSPWKLAGSFLPAHTSIAKELCPLVHGSLDNVTWGLSMAESHPILSSSHPQTLHSVSTHEFRLYYSLVTYICSHFYIPTIHQVLYVYVCWLRLFTGVGILSSRVFLIYLLESCLGI